LKRVPKQVLRPATGSWRRAAWENRATDSPLKTPDELLTLASVVEKETGHELDREMVASVFINRLKKGMPLQSDPTTIYGLGEGFDGNLRKKDLRHPSPYNTYVHRGLPPTPISLPSMRALQATARPAPAEIRPEDSATPPHTARQEPTGWREYEVQPGDELWDIAARELGAGERWRQLAV